MKEVYLRSDLEVELDAVELGLYLAVIYQGRREELEALGLDQVVQKRRHPRAKTILITTSEQTLGQKPSGPAAPRVFGLGSGLGGPSIYSLGTPLRTLGNLPRGSIHHYTPSAFPQIVPL